MTVRSPSPDQLRQLADGFGMHLSAAELAAFQELFTGAAAAYGVVDAMPDYLPPVKYPRTPGYQPEGVENPYNAWYVKSTIKGAPRGKLAGKTVVLKDNICLAGVPMMVGASTLEGYVPDVDATIVVRMLDAGATILGKAHCEYFCLSGSSNTGARGFVHNPWKRGYTAGGSSSGSAVLVAAGEADMAIGGDQGGSIRMPASFCGIVGLKPTYGLVPYTGVMPIELTLDHVGPMTRDVADNALLLEVIAGADGLDPRQYAPRTARYTRALGEDVRGLRIGVVGEGFGQGDAAVDAKVRNAAARFAQLGAEVEDVSLPLHAQGKAIWTPIGLEGLTELMMKGNGYGTNARGLFVTSLVDAHAHWRGRADEFSPTLKFALLAGEYFGQVYRHRYYAKAQNLSRKLRAAYDAALERHDILLMPTVPLLPTPMPAPGAPITEIVQHALGFNANCIPTNLTGHPALTVPCGLYDGLPVGMMLIARHWQETTLYQAAHAFEQAGDWRAL
ncbi:MAG: amidase [Gammaproteobacteria bacterium]